MDGKNSHERLMYSRFTLPEEQTPGGCRLNSLLKLMDRLHGNKVIFKSSSVGIVVYY